jgi:oxygen-independent coproporphyrinogen-3 oxidase
MSGLYIHIPFCKKICSYCDFYKTAVTSLIPDYLDAAAKELEIRKTYLQTNVIDTVYIGGGTPSLLTIRQTSDLFKSINKIFKIKPGAEITLEANPDDLTYEYLSSLRSASPVNRLSIGIQSLRDQDLKLLNRRHNAEQARQSIINARKAGYNNISIDLIYGIPGLGMQGWNQNLKNLPDVEHISAYHLTVEPGTSLSRKVSSGLLSIVDEDESSQQFRMLQEYAALKGFIHYEISNLSREGYESKHNSNYWKQEKYIGIGPSAHSFDLVSRQWNHRELKGYIQAISQGQPFFEREALDKNDRFNEYLMLSLRTISGAVSRRIIDDFGEQLHAHFLKTVGPFIKSGHIINENGIYKMTSAGWLISDYIVSAMVHL